MEYVFKFFFLPFYLLKIVVLIVATIITVLIGTVAMAFGAQAETYNSFIKEIWSEGIKYKGVSIFEEDKNSVESVFFIFFILLSIFAVIVLFVLITQ